jgi:radical SAM protein with 4Fe4S-binding SPASM domain
MRSKAVRLFLRSSTSKCRKCDRLRVEAAFDKLLGRPMKACVSCRVFSSIMKRLLKAERSFLGFGDADVRSVISNPSSRRGLVSVLRGIALFGVKKPQTVGAPFLVVWNFTNRCNLNCQHCYQDASANPSPGELSTEEAFDVVDQLADSSVVALSFSGGEPLIRKDFFEVARYAHGKGLYISLATNGTLITSRVAKKLKDHGVEYIDVSLDGASAETHDSFRGVKGSFDSAVRGIRACVEAGLYTCVATTITKRNFHEVENLIRLAKRLKVRRFILFNFIPTGRGKDIVEVDLSPEEREELLKRLYRELVAKVTGDEEGIECFATAPQLARVALQASESREAIPLAHYGRIGRSGAVLAEFIGGCGAGRIYCGINPDGKVLPCVFMEDLVVGDLRKEPFEEIWVKSKVLQELRDRDLLKGRCGRCPYRFVCGGCRARAYGYFGDYLMPDPGCIRELEEPSLLTDSFTFSK